MKLQGNVQHGKIHHHFDENSNVLYSTSQLKVTIMSI